MLYSAATLTGKRYTALFRPRKRVYGHPRAQRATAKALGVTEATINRDLKHVADATTDPAKQEKPAAFTIAGDEVARKPGLLRWLHNLSCVKKTPSGGQVTQEGGGTFTRDSRA